MKDLSMHILDIAQNSISAEAKLVEISMQLDYSADTLTLTIRDDGKGMPPELLAKVTSPFTTTRTTRKVGLGIPLLKAGAEQAGGSFELQSEPGRGTAISATYGMHNVDRPPLGEVAPSIQMLITLHPNIDFLFRAASNEDEFELDSREVKQVLDGVSLDDPTISEWLLDNLTQGFGSVFDGVV